MPDRASAVQKQKLDPCHLADKILFISTNNTKASKRMLPLICNLKMSLGWLESPNHWYLVSDYFCFSLAEKIIYGQEYPWA